MPILLDQQALTQLSNRARTKWFDYHNAKVTLHTNKFFRKVPDTAFKKQTRDLEFARENPYSLHLAIHGTRHFYTVPPKKASEILQLNLQQTTLSFFFFLHRACMITYIKQQTNKKTPQPSTPTQKGYLLSILRELLSEDSQPLKICTDYHVNT